MSEHDEIVRKSAILEVINRALDYSESLVELAGEYIDKGEGVTAKQYWYAGMVFKQFAEEIIDKEDKKTVVC